MVLRQLLVLASASAVTTRFRAIPAIRSLTVAARIGTARVTASGLSLAPNLAVRELVGFFALRRPLLEHVHHGAVHLLFVLLGIAAQNFRRFTAEDQLFRLTVERIHGQIAYSLGNHFGGSSADATSPPSGTPTPTGESIIEGLQRVSFGRPPKS